MKLVSACDQYFEFISVGLNEFWDKQINTLATALF